MRQSASTTPRSERRAGFSLIEVLAALAVTAAMVAVVVPLAVQLVARWWTGEAGIAAADAWMQAQLRLSDDLAQTVPMSIAGPEGPGIDFRADATHVRFVRPGIGSRSPETLDIVTLSVESTASGDILFRSSVPYTEGTFAAGGDDGHKTVLLEGPFRLRFRAVGGDGDVRATWKDDKTLPLRMVLSVQPTGPGYVPAAAIDLPIVARTRLADLAAQPGAAAHEPSASPARQR